MRIERPFHPGELEAQRLAGESAVAARNSAVISDAIIAGALPFLKQQSMVILGAESMERQLWALPLFGVPGFVTPLDQSAIRFDRTQMHEPEASAISENLRAGAQIGLLAIELPTRRRLRVNGSLTRVNGEEFVLAVKEAFPNCPKYIQRRTFAWNDSVDNEEAMPDTSGTTLTKDCAHLIEVTDTLFVASSHGERGADVSHRGGNPGFIQQVDEHVLRVPDYAGNSLFNTLGNFLIDSRAGVTLIDFAGRRMLQMTGHAVPAWTRPGEHAAGETGRYWTFTLDRWRMIPLPAATRWELIDFSPFNPKVK